MRMGRRRMPKCATEIVVSDGCIQFLHPAQSQPIGIKVEANLRAGRKLLLLARCQHKSASGGLNMIFDMISKIIRLLDFRCELIIF